MQLLTQHQPRDTPQYLRTEKEGVLPAISNSHLPSRTFPQLANSLWPAHTGATGARTERQYEAVLPRPPTHQTFFAHAIVAQTPPCVVGWPPPAPPPLAANEPPPHTTRYGIPLFYCYTQRTQKRRSSYSTQNKLVNSIQELKQEQKQGNSGTKTTTMDHKRLSSLPWAEACDTPIERKYCTAP